MLHSCLGGLRCLPAPISIALSLSRGITFRCKPLLRQQHVTRERTSLRRYFIANDISRLRAAVIALPFRHPASRRVYVVDRWFYHCSHSCNTLLHGRRELLLYHDKTQFSYVEDRLFALLFVNRVYYIHFSVHGLREKRVNEMIYKGYVPDYPYFVSFTDFFLSFLKYS